MSPEWRDMEESRQLFRVIKERISTLEMGLGRLRKTLDLDSADRTALQTAFDQGIIEGMVEVLDICGIQAA